LNQDLDPVSRPFGVWTAAALVVGGMIGSGIFVMPGQLAPFGWTGLAAWLVVIPGVLVLANVISKLIAARPHATGAGAIIGEALGPMPAVLINWSFWVSIWSANAVLSQTAIRYLAVFEPRLATSDMSLAIWSVVLLWMLTLLNLRGAKTAGRFQVVTTALKILPLVAVILIGGQLLATGQAGTAVADLKPFEGGGFTAALTLTFYAMVGFEAAGVAAERVRDPGRNIGRATLIGVALTGLLYLLVCSAVLMSIPADEVAASPAPVAFFVALHWGEGASRVIAAFAVIAVVGCLNGWVLIQGEHPLTMARAGLLPASLAVTSKRDVPVRVVLLGSICASVLLLSSVSADGGLLNFMLNLTSATSLIFYIGCCLAALRLRVAMGFAAVGICFALWVLIGSGSAAFLSIGLMAAALPLYWWARRSLPKNEASASTS
jgi:basic amino acid/polyamine antiporter, APA family